MALNSVQIGLVVLGVAFLAFVIGIGFAIPTWYGVNPKDDDNNDSKTTYKCSEDQASTAMACVEGILKSENCCSSETECQKLALDLMSGKVPGTDIDELTSSCLNYSNIQSSINVYEDVKTCYTQGFPKNWVENSNCSANAKACLCKTDDIIS